MTALAPDPRRTALLRRLVPGDDRARFGRFAVVSLLSLITGHVLLYGIHVWLGVAPVPSNLCSTTINTALVFVANRSWVWNVDDAVSIRREVVPFVLLALIGLAVSTTLVWVTASTIGEGLWVNLANLCGFGLVWIARYFVLDRVVYGAAST